MDLKFSFGLKRLRFPKINWYKGTGEATSLNNNLNFALEFVTENDKPKLNLKSLDLLLNQFKSKLKFKLCRSGALLRKKIEKWINELFAPNGKINLSMNNGFQSIIKSSIDKINPIIQSYPTTLYAGSGVAR
jgi:hypothetical protein